MRFRILLIATLFSTVPVVAQNAPPPVSVAHLEGVVETLEVRFPPSPEESGTEQVRGAAQWAQSFLRAGASGVQLRFENISFDADEYFEIEIVDANGANVQTLTPEMLAGRTALWTNIGRGQSLGVSVYGNRNGSLSFELKSISFDRRGMVLESIIGQDQRQHLYEYGGDLLDTVSRVSGAVAKLSMIKNTPNGPKRYVCTGFLVDDSTLVTNEHCVADQEACANTKVIFGYEYNRIGQIPGMEQYDCLNVRTVNVELDTAVLELAGEPGKRWNSLPLADQPAQDGERLFIIQHPAGEPKQISDSDCTVFESISPGRQSRSDFAHMCDTLGGSSGSPVFNVSGEVVGLHHWGRDISGRYSRSNRAVRMELVRTLLSPVQPVPEPPADAGPDTQINIGVDAGSSPDAGGSVDGTGSN
ncbi:V8-like Glu-specific endopeptidase [Hoeflea sp. IMCC20628]|uniref:trypsin-like serine peptidase n=1 Tax=Hoeflea sp. IMCC20628 TaxID=1620421 RepID=UPI00063B0936|nr:serine protease [Hoeflea sp. IMCC20628]AKI02708.1 V8-like Glu-specific endopeptidase [Hoeflea sp. IMCC20628]